MAVGLQEFAGGVILVSHGTRLITEAECDLWVCDKTLTFYEDGFELSRPIIGRAGGRGRGTERLMAERKNNVHKERDVDSQEEETTRTELRQEKRILNVYYCRLCDFVSLSMCLLTPRREYYIDMYAVVVVVV